MTIENNYIKLYFFSIIIQNSKSFSGWRALDALGASSGFFASAIFILVRANCDKLNKFELLQSRDSQEFVNVTIEKSLICGRAGTKRNALPHG